MAKTWLYHKIEPAVVFESDTDDMTRLYDEGWRDTPAAFFDIPDSEPEESKPAKPKK